MSVRARTKNAPETAKDARVVLDEEKHASRLAAHAVTVHEHVLACADLLEELLVRGGSLHDVELLPHARDGALRTGKRSQGWLRHDVLGW